MHSTASARESLAGAALSLQLPEDAVRERQRAIHEGVRAHSRHVRAADFREIGTRDLEYLFAAYDERFLGGLCRASLGERRLRFALSARMTKSGGITKKIRWRNGDVSYEIAVAATMLFQSFAPADRQVTVCGLECEDRLSGLQRIFEHELVHLVELLCWDTSECSAARFQGIARRLFLHRAHTHDLITAGERAAASGIRPGARVRFSFEGRELTGVVNRVTKRATVLVPDPVGRRYSDGNRYQVYYIPLPSLQRLPADR